MIWFNLIGTDSAGNSANHGGGINVLDSTVITLPLSYCSFLANNAVFGGAIGCATSIANHGGANVDLMGKATFRSNTAVSGGALYVQGLQGISVKFSAHQGPLFENNSASNGGAIAATFFVSIELIGATFRSNFVNMTGGAVVILSDSNFSLFNGRFEGNRAGSSGGAVTSYASQVSFNVTTFVNNSAQNPGGAVAIFTTSQLLLRSCRLANNSIDPFSGDASYCNNLCGGGAIFAGDSSSVTSSESVFESNTAWPGDGGAIFARDQVQLRSMGGTMKANRAQGFGGAVSVSDTAISFLGNGLQFERNTAGKGGGAIFFGGGPAQLGTIVVDYNSADQVGGGVLMYSTVNIISDVKVRNNAATNGGGIFASGWLARLTVGVGSTLVLQNNSASSEGGGIYLEDSSGYDIESESCPGTCSSQSRGDGVCHMEW